jgi:hypothetical protein
MYISFMSFKKFQILAQNTKGLAFGFTEKRQLAVKTDQNYVFLGRKVQILDMLHIMVMYISFYGFKYFFFNFQLKIQMGYSSVLTKNACLRQKLTENPYFLVVK